MCMGALCLIWGVQITKAAIKHFNQPKMKLTIQIELEKTESGWTAEAIIPENGDRLCACSGNTADIALHFLLLNMQRVQFQTWEQQFNNNPYHEQG